MKNYEIKARLVRDGKSQIFRNWNEFAGVTEEEFISALEWLCADPMNGGSGNGLTRELGCICFGKNPGLRKLTRRYYRDGSFAGFYQEDGSLWVSCSGTASISAQDRI